MRTLSQALLVVMLLAGCHGPTPSPRPVADEDSRRHPPAGEVVGFVGTYGNHAWEGIPYAEPPVGARRWRAPIAKAHWEGRLEALAPGAVCPQYTSRFAGVDGPAGTIVGDEDCLTLNVYAPRRTPQELERAERAMPVMVWIHGGGNVIGHSGYYDGGNLARTHDVIVVTINYRLGPLGWLRHQALRSRADSDAERSGNFGVLDMILALTWVRDNITSFGGDLYNVTIFGESAGGRDVLALLSVPEAGHLFHRAISQSGGLRRNSVVEAEHFVDDAEPGHANSSGEVLARLLVADGKAVDRAGARRLLETMSQEEVADFWYSRTAEQLQTVYRTDEDEGLIDVPQMFRDGVVLRDEDPMESLGRMGGYKPVPVILGTNKDETKLFQYADPRQVRKLLWMLPRLVDADRYAALAEHLSRQWKARGVDEPAAALRRSGAPGVWAYRFEWDEEPVILGSDMSRMLGAAHGFEIPFVFDHFRLGAAADRLFTDDNLPGRRELAAAIMSYWAEFAFSGDPGRGRDGSLPRWETAPAFMVLDTEAGGGLRMAEGSLTEAAVLGDVPMDPRLTDMRERCRVFHELIRWSDRLTPADYPAVGGKGCAAYPWEDFPW